MSTFSNLHFRIMSSNGSVVSESNTRYVPKTYAIPNDQPVVALDARTAFEKLTEREQLYAHYISRYVVVCNTEHCKQIFSCHRRPRWILEVFCWIYTFLFLKYYVGDWSRRQAYDKIVQATHLSTPHQKTDENSEIMKLKLQFESILGHL